MEDPGDGGVPHNEDGLLGGEEENLKGGGGSGSSMEAIVRE